MALATWILACAASLAPLSRAWIDAGWLAPGRHSHVALCLLPWLALAGLPGRSARFSASLWPLGLLVPVAVAGSLDLRAGFEPLAVALEVAAGLALVTLLAAAAARASRAETDGPGRSHALAWFALVPGGLAWQLARTDGIALREAPSSASAVWTHASPLSYALRGLALEPGKLERVWPWDALLVAGLLYIVAAAAARRS